MLAAAIAYIDVEVAQKWLGSPYGGKWQNSHPAHPFQLLSHFTRRRLSSLISLQLFPCALSIVSAGAYPVHILVHPPALPFSGGASIPPRASRCGRLPAGLPTQSTLVQRAGQCYQMLLEKHCCSISPLLAHIHTTIQPHDARPKGVKYEILFG
jgi:hypothetical protein